MRPTDVKRKPDNGMLDEQAAAAAGGAAGGAAGRLHTPAQCELCIPCHGITLIQDDQLELVAANTKHTIQHACHKDSAGPQGLDRNAVEHSSRRTCKP